MYRAPLRPLCEILLASLLLSVACKSAPIIPTVSETSESDAQIAQLEADRAEILEAQKQLDADMKLAEAGWPSGKPAPKVEASYSSKGGKYDDETIIDIKTNIKTCTEKKDHAGAQSWFKKLLAKCKSRKKELDQVLVDVEVNIDNYKKDNPKYGDFVPGNRPPVYVPPADGKWDGDVMVPPAETRPTSLPPGKGVDLPTQKVELPTQKK